MSQIIVPISGGSLPPSIPTSFVTQDGTGVPAANILLINAYDSIENNVNGVVTKGGVNSGDPPGTGATNEVDVYLTNRISISATTSDGAGQTQTVTLMTPTNATSVTFKALVSGYDAISNVAIGGEQLGLARKSAGVVTIVGTNDTFDESDVLINTADWNVISGGATLQFQFIGVAGQIIDWRVIFEYTQAP